MKLYSVINPPCTFCDPGKSFEKDLEDILCSTLFTSAAQQPISEIYDDMRVNVNSAIKPKLYPLPASLLSSAVIRNGLTNANGKVFAGHDLPIWLNNPETADVRIMIVGQNPYRDDETMKANNCNGLGISTPWGIHSLTWRKGILRGLLFHVAMELIDMCAAKGKTLSVYITDAYKLCKVDTTAADTANANLYKDILEKEIELVNPDIIIPVGDAAQNMIPKSNRVLNLPHPNARPATWKRYGYNAPDYSALNKGDFYISEIVNFAKGLGIC